MNYAVLDFETTGDQPNDEVIQVGLVRIEQNRIVDRYAAYVNPGREIPPFITQLTGITDEMVKDASREAEAAAELRKRISDDDVLIAHHAAFDLNYLQKMLIRHGLPRFAGRTLDTTDWLRMLHPGLNSVQLSLACAQLGIPHERPHQADSDAEATAALWLRCLERLEHLPLLTVQRLSALFEGDLFSSGDTADLSWFLMNMREQRELDTGLDLNSDRYFRQFALQAGDWSEEEPAERETGLFGSRTSFADYYGELKLRLQQKFEQFEERQAQDQMAEAVFDAFDAGRHLMVEAGTGTGKSLGYLIPSLFYGIVNDQKMLVSTHTINLQEQLKHRDLPLLKEIVPLPFRAAVLKGRSHYLCLRKFEHKINNRDYMNVKDELIAAAQMLVWLGETGTGDEEELQFGQRGGDFWRTVESDSESCLNRACPWFKKCFYHRARHEASIADVIITNHSLLFADMKADNRLLPPYDHLIIDEAHHFEETASKHLGTDLQYFSMVNTLARLYKDSRSGLLPSFTYRLQREAVEHGAKWVPAMEAASEAIVKVKEAWDELCDGLYSLLTRESDASQTETGQFVFRLKKEALPEDWDRIVLLEDNIHVELSGILKKLDSLLADMKEQEDEFDLQSALTDLSGVTKELQRHKEALRYILTLPEDNQVYWVEASGHFRSKSVQLYSVPIDVSGLLKTYFFDVKQSIVLTSATLSVDKTFDYACGQLGLKEASEKGRLQTLQLASPFNYRQQALVCIPRDFPTVRGREGEAQFIESLAESLAQVAEQTEGRMLVLFTSNRMLKAVHQLLKEKLASAGLQVLGQGVDSGNRSKLTQLFQRNSRSVLLGTSSFWEGVDIPGDALSCLAIVRLPFQPPNHPVVDAKTEYIRKQNKNPFMVYSVPHAVIRFKQGFGRLVRRATDRGIVIIYDTRVLESRYGRQFLYSLPGPKIEHMRTVQLVERVKQWMEA